MTDHIIALTIYAGFAIGTLKIAEFGVMILAQLEHRLN